MALLQAAVNYNIDPNILAMMPSAADQAGVERIDAEARQMSRLLDRHDGDAGKALAAIQKSEDGGRRTDGNGREQMQTVPGPDEYNTAALPGQIDDGTGTQPGVRNTSGDALLAPAAIESEGRRPIAAGDAVTSGEGRPDTGRFGEPATGREPAQAEAGDLGTGATQERAASAKAGGQDAGIANQTDSKKSRSLGEEITALKERAVAAIEANPALKAQAESQAGSVEQYVNDWAAIFPASAAARTLFGGQTNVGDRVPAIPTSAAARNLSTNTLAPESSPLTIGENTATGATLQASTGGMARVLSQPLDANVDLDAPVTVVRAAPKFSGQNPLALRKSFPQAIKDRVLKAFNRGVVNYETGDRIGMSGVDFKKHLFIEPGEDGLAHLEAVASLPALMRVAKVIETHYDTSATADGRLENVRRFIAPFSVGGKTYSVLLTVKRFKEGKWLLDTENPVRLYHHRVEKELPPPSSRTNTVERADDATSVGSNTYTIRELVQGVKDPEGNVYAQTLISFFSNRNKKTSDQGMNTRSDGSGESGSLASVQRTMHDSAPAGTVSSTNAPNAQSITSTDGKGNTYEQRRQSRARGQVEVREQATGDRGQARREYVISLFDSADLSTLLHETGHIYLEELESAVLDGTASDSVKADYLTLRRWLGKLGEDPGTLLTRAQREKFARGFEQYLREGKAPSKSLARVFARFKEWLSAIYQDAKQLRVRLNDDVRQVFDRLVAREQEGNNSLAYEQNLQRDADAWRSTVDSFFDGTLNPRRLVPMLSQTPLALQLAGAKNLPVVTTYNILRKILVEKKHLPESTLKDVPAALANPIMVFESATEKGSIVAMVDLKDKTGATVVVPIALNAAPRGYEVNLATSVYGRQTASGRANNGWFQRQIEAGRLLYINKQKSREWAKTGGLASDLMDRSAPTSLAGNPALRADSVANIPSENDLRKARENAGNIFYQDENDSRSNAGGNEQQGNLPLTNERQANRAALRRVLTARKHRPDVTRGQRTEGGGQTDVSAAAQKEITRDGMRINPETGEVIEQSAEPGDSLSSVVRPPSSAAPGELPKSKQSPKQQAANDPGYNQDAGTIAFKFSKKKDIKAFTPVYATAEYTLTKDPAGQRMLAAAEQRADDKISLENKIIDGINNSADLDEYEAKHNGFIKTFKELKKAGEKGYAKVRDYLLECDREGQGFTIKYNKGDKYKKEAPSWQVLDPKGKDVGKPMASEQEAVARMIAEEGKRLKHAGYSDQEVAAVATFRGMTNRAFDQMIADWKALEAKYEELGLDPPTFDAVDETRRWAIMDKKGKVMATFGTREAAELAMEIAATANMKAKPKFQAIKRQDDNAIRFVPLAGAWIETRTLASSTKNP